MTDGGNTSAPDVARWPHVVARSSTRGELPTLARGGAVLQHSLRGNWSERSALVGERVHVLSVCE
jgi:hypothetical protein